MKKCELCNSMARMYCESDQASLCWDCDARVHSANFLVTKHSRVLLCHACQSLTPWTGSGPKLAPTVSVCQACVNRSPNIIDGDRDLENDAEDDSGNEDDHSDTDEDDGDNQVVPLSATSLPPSMASCSSSSEESSSKYLRERDRASSSNTEFFSSRTAENGRALEEMRRMVLARSALGHGDNVGKAFISKSCNRFIQEMIAKIDGISKLDRA